MRDDLQEGVNEVEAAVQTADLRVLATSDIHAQLLGFDYIQDGPGPHHGLAGLASLVAEARSEAAATGAACILLDNGDLLQGSALGTHMAQIPVNTLHPLVATLSHLGYDAQGLGNHDLDHGLDYLNAIAAAVPAPVISSNLLQNTPNAIQRSAIIERTLPSAPAGMPGSLSIGVISALPESTAIWNATQLEGRAAILPARSGLQNEIDALKRRGADIILLLAHMGMEPNAADSGLRDDARDIANLDHVDAVISGHTHLRLPGNDHAGLPSVDATGGRLHARPAVMPGYEASDLAVLDLRLRHDTKNGWQVTQHRCQLRPNSTRVSPDATLTAICKPAQEKTRATLAAPCVFSAQPIHNYFSTATPTPCCALVANAKHHAVSTGIAGLPDADLPLLAAAAAHTAGGRGGPHHFIRIPSGRVLLRHLGGLSPYANTICALRITGTELRQWLEHAAKAYPLLQEGTRNQPLLDKSRPAFNFDTIFGIDYAIDPTRPTGQRIRDLCWNDRPISPDQLFILATDTFRAAGGGGGPRFPADRIIYRSDQSLLFALATVLQTRTFAFDPEAKPWRFACATPVQAVFRTSPAAEPHLKDILALRPRMLDPDADGFARIQLTL